MKHDCFHNSKVIDVRSFGTKRSNIIGTRRRRECLICGRRFTTREVEAETLLTEQEQAQHKELLLNLTKKFQKLVEQL